MIPLKLTLRNFLCYGESAPTLDLEGIHVACLCGQNGHGKSALLDAITWALWGKARGKTQDELVRHGYDEMLVELEFQSRDVLHRVVRRHAIGGGRRRQGASDLQLQIDTGDGFRSITGNSMRETQVEIDQITGMDYDTFINSAFLLQGRADEFTNKTPGERKEVLAKILDLGFYDRLQELAKGRADDKRIGAGIVQGELEHMRGEVARRDGYSSQLEVVNRDLEEVSRGLQENKDARDSLKARVDDLRRKRDELETVSTRIPTIQEEISHHQKDIDARQERISGYDALIQERESIETGAARLRQVRDRHGELNRAREEFDDLTGRKRQLETVVESAKARLEEQVRQLEWHVKDGLRPKADASTSIQVRLEEARERLAGLETEEQDLADKRRSLNELSARMGEFTAAAEQLKSEGQELRSKLNLVQNSHQGARCPLCGTELGPEGGQHLSDSYNAQIQEKLRLYGENESALKAAAAEKLHLDNELPRHETALRLGQGEVQSALAVLEREMEESRQAAEQLEQVVRELDDAGQRLEQRSYATEERQQLAELGTQIGTLGYDPKAHGSLYDEMQELQPFEEGQRRLEEALRSLPEEQESLDRAQDMLKRRRTELVESETRQQEMEADILELPGSEEALLRAEAGYREFEARHSILLRQQGELEGELKKLEVVETQIDGKEAHLRNLRREQAIFQELVEAFGKRGVQAMLIETALPRVEEEANTLLGRMTDNRMHLKLESQREPKSRKGEPIETLEIKVSDELGPRSYELFSGGEAFRINLALRIALSKVLAHRRGAPLPTLFIDEGFGTQDSAGRERILDVIRAIEEDFEKIIVITHLDELKDVFPVRIEVQKQATGSTFWIS